MTTRNRPATAVGPGTLATLSAALPAAEHLAAAAISHPVRGTGLWWLTFRHMRGQQPAAIRISSRSVNTTGGRSLTDAIRDLTPHDLDGSAGSMVVGYAVMDVDAERLLCVDRHGSCAYLTGPRARPGTGFDRHAVEPVLRRMIGAGPGYLLTAGHRPGWPALTELRTGHLHLDQEARFTPVWSIADRQPPTHGTRIGYTGRYRGTGPRGIAVAYPPAVIDAIVADHHRHRDHVQAGLQRAGLTGWLLHSELIRSVPDLARHHDLLVIDERALTADPAARTVVRPEPDGSYLLSGTHLMRWVPIAPPPQPRHTSRSAAASTARPAPRHVR